MFKPLTVGLEWEWFVEKTHVIRCEDTQGIVAYDGRGIAGVFVCDSFSVDACCTHLALENPLCIRRGFFSEIARHLFVTLQRKRVFGQVPDNNTKALRLNKKIGYVEVARVPNAVQEGIGYIIMDMTPESCRFFAPMSEVA